MPEFEREERIELQAVVGTTCGVVGAELLNGCEVDQPPPPNRLLREQVLDQRSELVVEPGPDWGAEACLTPPDHGAGQCSLLAALEDVLAPQALDLELGRDSRRELDERV